jgi:hypothetical protein
VELARHDCYGARHDCYRESSPPEAIVDDVVLLLSEGDLARLISAARLAVTDWRYLKVVASEKRDHG